MPHRPGLPLVGLFITIERLEEEIVRFSSAIQRLHTRFNVQNIFIYVEELKWVRGKRVPLFHFLLSLLSLPLSMGSVRGSRSLEYRISRHLPRPWKVLDPRGFLQQLRFTANDLRRERGERKKIFSMVSWFFMQEKWPYLSQIISTRMIDEK